eukprot:390554_1
MFSLLQIIILFWISCNNFQICSSLDCIWYNGANTLNLTLVKGKTLSMNDPDDALFSFSISPCGNFLDCGGAVMALEWYNGNNNASPYQCVRSFAVWNNGTVAPNYNPTKKQWEFIYPYGTPPYDGQFQVYWDCDYSKNNTAELVAVANSSGYYPWFQISLSLACN